MTTETTAAMADESTSLYPPGWYAALASRVVSHPADVQKHLNDYAALLRAGAAKVPTVDVAKANDYDRIANLARLRRYALEEIAGSKSLTATPEQEARHYQHIARKCLDEAGAQATYIATQPAPDAGVVEHAK